MKLALLFAACTAFFSAASQKSIDVDKNVVNPTAPDFFMVVGGEPFVLTKFSRLVEGTPYFNSEWMMGNITLNGGRKYTGISVKLDLVDNEVHYQDNKGSEL